ncbi:MAG: C1 family peptidase [Abditibacteriota bacterium]|nr:C1 family peptidase [Abditibacteriota bacterium]
MKKITPAFLEATEAGYLAGDIYTVARHALAKNSIGSVTRISEQTEFTRNRFSVNIETLPATNQKSSGRCWIFAGCNVLRELVAKKYDLKEFELSQNFVAFYDKLEKCNFFMENVIALKKLPEEERTLDTILARGIEDGGQWDMFVNIIRKYGAAPKDAFPETYQSSNSAEINHMLNKYVRRFAYEARQTRSAREIGAKKDEALANIYKMLCSAFGVPPKRFSFECVNKSDEYHIIKDITPREFASKYIGVDFDDYASIINSPTADKPFNKTYTVKYLGNVTEGRKVKYINLEMARLKELVIAQLKDGEPVWFGSDCSKEAVRDEGVWDDLSYDRDRLFQIDTRMSKGAMLDMRESAMNHAMVITGVNLDEDRPTKWKIQNSWGEETANKGYFVATDSWFDQYVYQAVVHKKHLAPAEIKDLDKEPVKLELWDPMGTLAD